MPLCADSTAWVLLPPTGKDVNDTLCHRLGIPIRGSHSKEPER